MAKCAYYLCRSNICQQKRIRLKDAHMPNLGQFMISLIPSSKFPQTQDLRRDINHFHLCAYSQWLIIFILETLQKSSTDR